MKSVWGLKGCFGKDQVKCRCIHVQIMTSPARIYPEPMEGAGSDSPEALLAGGSEIMGDSEDDEDEHYIPALVNKKVSNSVNIVQPLSKVRWSSCTILSLDTSCISEAGQGYPCIRYIDGMHDVCRTGCVQRPSAVRINLNGDVPSVPIPLAKRKPSLKQPTGGQRVSLYVKKAVERSGSSFWSFLQQQRPRANATGSTVGSAARVSSFAAWLSGKQKTSSQQKAVTRYSICSTFCVKSLY